MRGQEDYGAAVACLDHALGGDAAALEGRPEVAAQSVVPGTGFGVEERAAGDGQAGDNQDVETPEAVNGLLDGGAGRIGVGEVAGEGEHAVRRHGGAVGVEGDVGALGHEFGGNGESEAGVAVGAGDERGLAAERAGAHHISNPAVMLTACPVILWAREEARKATRLPMLSGSSRVPSGLASRWLWTRPRTISQWWSSSSAGK